MNIAIINGPNLNLIGSREPNIYGNDSLAEYLISLRSKYSDISFRFFQSNVEGEIINEIQACSNADAIIINAGAYSHTSIAIADALKAVQPMKIIEVHISNIFAREEYRHHSFITPLCMGLISGFGLSVYQLAVESLLLGKN